MKPKQSQKVDVSGGSKRDQCQTPPYALNPLLPYIKQFKHVWEPAKGEGYLERALQDKGFKVTATGLVTGHNFFYADIPDGCEIQITNPAFTLKYLWAGRSCELGLPFALLVPVEFIGSAQGQILMEKYGFELILYKQRVDFKMPEKGWRGSGAQFPTMWLTWGLNIGQQITFENLNKPSKKEREQWDDENS